VKNNALGVYNTELAANETRVLKIHLGNLAFALHGPKVCSPGDSSGRNVFIAGDFDGLKLVPALLDPDYLVEMPRVMADPFAYKF